jgi:pyruvate/2-oxoglutarate dehydrogenase complex dihydrolipoamide acyltransferase (E2) component
MRVAIEMPRMGEEDEARIVAWLKAVGDPVTRGEAVAEIETDKATLDVEATRSGTLAEIVEGAGADVAVGTPIGYLETDG